MQSWSFHLIPALCLAGLVPSQDPAPSKTATSTIKVFLLAGQSNMEGQGVVSMDHQRYYNGGKGNLVWSMKHGKTRARMTHLRGEDGKWVVRDDVDISFKDKRGVRKGPLTIGYTGYGKDTHIGPELQFGHVIGDHYKQPVLLIKTAWGGKSLYKDFRPPSSSGDTGAYYTKMLEEVRAALGALKQQKFELAGFIWMQGWNDMVNKAGLAEYEQNLVNLAKDIRKEFKSPKLPVVIGELGNGGEQKKGNMFVLRQAQRRAAARIDHAVLVSTTAFARPRELSPCQGHGHHWFANAESYFLIGDALGKGMIGLAK